MRTELTADRLVRMFKGTKEKKNIKIFQDKFASRGHTQIWPFERIVFATKEEVTLNKGEVYHITSHTDSFIEKGLQALHASYLDEESLKEIGIEEGEVAVVLYNMNPFPIDVFKGDCIAFGYKN